MSFAVGSLIKARHREWVVLPETTSDTVIARPLGGGDDEIAGFYLPLEKVEPATFQLPDPTQAGDYRSGRLLRDALRLGFRSSAGPFRSFARLGVEPRPYQLVPLLMALKLDPVRLLIADDVGIGKTIEAGLIIRELIDRGEVRRFAVLSPPQIAEQWQKELADKFHLDAELVLPGTVTRLEKACRLNQSIFDRFPFVIVSTDFIKSDRRRDDFVRACPELVIVDEAHTCAKAGDRKGTRHQRHQLITQLASNPQRNLLLVTATPHSGNEDAFRSLLSLLSQDFAVLPADLSGDKNRKDRERIAAHFVQRRRADIRHFLQTDTPFPERMEAEETYKLHADYAKLFKDVLDYAKDSVTDPTLNKQRQRIRWWSALALLRSMASSPAAAMATLRTEAERQLAGKRSERDQIQGRLSQLNLDVVRVSQSLTLAQLPDNKADLESRKKEISCGMTGCLHLVSTSLPPNPGRVNRIKQYQEDKSRLENEIASFVSQLDQKQAAIDDASSVVQKARRLAIDAESEPRQRIARCDILLKRFNDFAKQIALSEQNEVQRQLADTRIKELVLERETRAQSRTAQMELLNTVFREVTNGLIRRSTGNLSLDLVSGLTPNPDATSGEAFGSAGHVLGFDLTCLAASIYGHGFHPRLLVHDSPREADLNEMIYRNLFRYVLSLESYFPGEEPGFQYIISTTSPAPDLVPTDNIRATLHDDTPEGRLFSFAF